MEKILVPTDFSANSELALQYAIDLGLQDKAKLILFNDAIKEEEVEKANTGLKSALEDIKSKHNSAGELTIESRSETGPVMEGFNKMLKDDKYDLISMLTHDDDKLDFNVGSISTKIAQKGKASSILIPENNSYQPIKNILIVNDFTDARTDEPAFKHLAKLLQKIDAKAYLLQANYQHAKVPSSDDTSSVMGDLKPEQTEQSTFETYKELISQVSEHVEKHKIQMIFLPNTQAIFEKIFVGNLARKLALDTKIPVYIYF
ncbi:universal stress protein [Catalinimonas sp. 4WD22]|uniref:universal stress protein n=1 Tax=Catalinimonas locisalis TaxID=3133978 RepID=UPI0031011799